MINLFIQARMTSQRFPGKVLAPFLGKPVIKHLIDSIKGKGLENIDRLVVLTSEDKTDDPLVAYLESLGVESFRGNLKNVFFRFQEALESYPCDWFVRLCADSPLLAPFLIEKAISYIQPEIDIISNVHERTFPKGQSVEVICTKTFQSINMEKLDQEDREHVTTHFYRNSDQFRILSFFKNREEGHISTCIDSIEDLQRHEKSFNEYNFLSEVICEKIV